MYHLSLQGSLNLSDIDIGSGIFQQTAKHIAEKFHPSRIHVVTDSNVAPLYLDKLTSQFPMTITTTIIPAGEEQKNLATVSSLYDDLCEAGLTRSDLLIALGGGVVGDISGFAAATYLRGIRFCQIPTTLLAQVDSSVGGKCGVDLPQGKNLVGAFYQPELVLVDPALLTSLSDRIFCDGMAEVIKYGCISNKAILDLISAPDFRANIEQIVYECVRIKRDVVQADEHDNGLRMILNFGHTIGHAAEKLGHYIDLSHGQAVAIGMVAAAHLNAMLGGNDLTEQITALCTAHHLPTELPYDREAVYQSLLSDKKMRSETMNMILVDTLGNAEIRPLNRNELQQLVKQL